LGLHEDAVVSPRRITLRGYAWLLMIAPALFSTVLIMVAAGARSFYERRRRRHMPTGA
jgi:hypothetical protein